jgi:hypothetical protein
MMMMMMMSLLLIAQAGCSAHESLSDSLGCGWQPGLCNLTDDPTASAR